MSSSNTKYIPYPCPISNIALLRAYHNICRFMCVLVSLIFSVLSTIAEYEKFANDILYWMVMIVTR